MRDRLTRGNRTRPSTPAVRRPTNIRLYGLGALGLLGLGVMALTWAPHYHVLWSVLLTAEATFMILVGLHTLRYSLEAWQLPGNNNYCLDEADAPQLSISLIVPARREEAVLEGTLESLADLNHPSYEVLVVVDRRDDQGTAAIADKMAGRYPGLLRVVDYTDHKHNKPIALNTALPFCRFEVVGIIDAEDTVSRELLRHVDYRFRTQDADIVQGGVQLMNFQDNTLALHNCLEYFRWFASRLKRHVREGPTPLGGNTVFFTAELLHRVGGWGRDALAEDCRIGFEASVEGAKIDIFYHPALVTREEAPVSIRAHNDQRTRWNTGFLQVLREGSWRRLPTRRERRLAVTALAMPYVQAFSSMLVPISILRILFLEVPVLIALYSTVPFLMTLVAVALDMAILREFATTFGMSTRVRDYVRLVAGAPIYQVLLQIAAVRGAMREAQGNTAWMSTAHEGLHRQAATLEAGR